MPSNAYIHIPFCKSKCKYCSFISFVKPEIITGYMYSLMKEISDNYKGELLQTLYFGGGTPSLVPLNLIEKTVNKFKLENNAEITLEINPDDSNYDYLNGLIQIGINRLSIGSQTFDNYILQQIGRRHNAYQIEKTVEDAKNAGFKNISVDLIYGLPHQTMENLRYDIKKILSLGVQHISTYGLKIEDESYYGKHIPENLPDDDMQADMYEEINELFERNNYKRYEISNFAMENFESKHNLNYWDNNEYYGFGVAAHGYTNGVRYYNSSDINKYMENPSSAEYGKFLTEQEKLEEEIFLGFRKTSGIDTKKINSKFNINFDKKYEKILSKFKDYIDKTPSGYALNLRGILISNLILAEFIQ